MAKKKNRVIVITAILFFLCLALAACGLLLYRRKSGNGVKLESEKNFPVPELSFYLQRDKEWEEDRLGDSRFTMGSSGCLVTCIASLLSACGEEITPGELNRRFTEHGVYNESGDIIWEKITAVYPDLEMKIPRTVNAEAIEEALEAHQYPLIRVKNHGNGYWHWVLLIGSDERGYLCMDPLYGDMEPRPLHDHGDTVYSYRLLWFSH